jgi:hypothetical protein
MGVYIQKEDELKKVAGLYSSEVMTGATATTQGVPGLVPTPLVDDRNSFLRGDGTWVDPGFYDVINDINNALEEVKEETRERINYYDNIADIALANVDDKLNAILDDVKDHGETKKEEISEQTETEKTAINNLGEQKQTELTETTESETKAIVQNVSDKADESIEKLNEILEDFQSKANDGLDTEHVTKKIIREQGIHGIRYYNDRLEYEDANSEWQVAVDDTYITYHHEDDDTSEVEDYSNKINVEQIIGLDQIATSGKVIIADDVTDEKYLLGIANGKLYIRLIGSDE